MAAAISIGGTGMLGPATQWLATEGYEVAVLSRSPEAFCRNDERLHPLPVDWSNQQDVIEEAFSFFSHTIGRLLVWFHGAWHGLPLKLAQALSAKQQASFDVTLVLGSAVSDPSRDGVLDEIKSAFEPLANCRLHLVLLGFKTENGVSRWLTNEEISRGAIDAMASGAEVTTIGRTRPWSARP